MRLVDDSVFLGGAQAEQSVRRAPGDGGSEKQHSANHRYPPCLACGQPPGQQSGTGNAADDTVDSTNILFHEHFLACFGGWILAKQACGVGDLVTLVHSLLQRFPLNGDLSPREPDSSPLLQILEDAADHLARGSKVIGDYLMSKT